jgi:hypothetical protein
MNICAFLVTDDDLQVFYESYNGDLVIDEGHQISIESCNGHLVYSLEQKGYKYFHSEVTSE